MRKNLKLVEFYYKEVSPKTPMRMESKQVIILNITTESALEQFLPVLKKLVFSKKLKSHQLFVKTFQMQKFI